MLGCGLTGSSEKPEERGGGGGRMRRREIDIVAGFEPLLGGTLRDFGKFSSLVDFIGMGSSFGYYPYKKCEY